MAGFEIVVRPVIFPNIRPAPSRALPPEDDPDKGICEIKFFSDHHVTLSTNFSASTSGTKPLENHRRVDEARIYQTEDDGTVNKDNYIDIQIANKIVMDETGPTSSAPGAGLEAKSEGERQPWYMERIEEADNIQILERDKIVRKGD